MSGSTPAPNTTARQRSSDLPWASASGGRSSARKDRAGTAGPGIGDRIGDSALQHFRNFAYLGHEVIELLGEQRLLAIAERAVGIGVDFDDETVSPDGNRGARQRRHLVTLAGSVAGIDD